MLVLEINEANLGLMQQAAHTLSLANLSRILAFRHSTTTTPDTAERHGLDPWVQWVSVHTGVPASVHGIRHLGDAEALQLPQLWDYLDQAGFSHATWNAMNARRTGSHGLYFFPDPWSFRQTAWPPALDGLLALPRYYAQHYGNLRLPALATAFARTAGFLLRPSVLPAVLALLPDALRPLARGRLNGHTLVSLSELVSAAVLARLLRQRKPDLVIAGFNCIAHLQHHAWHAPRELSPDLAVGFRCLDRAIGLLLSALPPDEPVVLATALSQDWSKDNGETLYTPKDPHSLLAALGLAPRRIERLMTNDAHVFFATAAEAAQARDILVACRVGDTPCFTADIDPADPCKLFYQLVFWGPATAQSVLRTPLQALPFLDHFRPVVLRTGSHSRLGHVWSSHLDFPDGIDNHAIGRIILRHFGCDMPAQPAAPQQ